MTLRLLHHIINGLRTDIAHGLGVLTRLSTDWIAPVTNQPSASAFPMARSVWTWPFIGAGIGFLQALLINGLHKAGFFSSLAVILGIIFQLLLTGGLHEDGLADSCDGFGGGQTIADKLRIMRDSHIGAYGVLALIMLVFLRYNCIVFLTNMSRISIALPIASALGRGIMATLLWTTPFAQNDGLARSFGRPPILAFLANLCGIAMLLFAFLDSLNVLYCTGLSLICFFGVKHLAIKQVKGISGDILGASCTLTEIIIFIALTRLRLP